jgi:transposase
MSYVKRKRIGKSVYLYQVRSVRRDGKVRQEYLQYLGKEPTSKSVLELKTEPTGPNVKIDVIFLLLHVIACELNLPSILGEHWKVILCLTYAHCRNYRGIKNVAAWMKKTNIGYLLNLKNVKEKRCLSALDDLDSKDLADLQMTIFTSVKKALRIRPRGILFDVTNTFFFGKSCPLGKRGKSKEGRHGKRLIQLGLGVTQKEGIPVFCKTLKGNTHDSRVFLDMLSDFFTFGIKNGIFIFDRGISSKTVQNLIAQNGWDVICGLPINPALKKIIRANYRGVKNCSIESIVKCDRTVFYVIQVPYCYGKVKGTLAICFDPKKDCSIRNDMMSKVADARKNFTMQSALPKKLKSFFTENGRVLETKLEDFLEFCGFSLLYSTGLTRSNEEIVKFYFEKDLVEKSFSVIKGVAQLRPIRHRLSRRVNAHVFICYLTNLLLSILKYKVKALGLSIDAIFQELELFTPR